MEKNLKMLTIQGGGETPSLNESIDCAFADNEQTSSTLDSSGGTSTSSRPRDGKSVEVATGAAVGTKSFTRLTGDCGNSVWGWG